ncbi:uncharacterized protein LOC109416657 [Aedes albopictus]|uniref:Secreted protein n=1 Tax=Aedes albopictus TaxID=7160 RepID=A0ABM1YW66_AEDAL
MMKVVVVLTALFAIAAGYYIPRQNAFIGYPQPMGYQQWAQRTMYGVHLTNQQFRNQRVSDFDAGLHPNDCQHTDTTSAELPVHDSNEESIADAYPSVQLPVEEEPVRDVPAVFEDEVEDSIEDEPLTASAVSAAVPATVPENKKKTVSARADSSEEEDQDTPTGQGSIGSAFFPINFGSASGGSIAIANSYSTGKGGSATSTATAYGSPATVGLKRVPAPQLRKRPAKLRGRQ